MYLRFLWVLEGISKTNSTLRRTSTNLGSLSSDEIVLLSDIDVSVDTSMEETELARSGNGSGMAGIPA